MTARFSDGTRANRRRLALPIRLSRNLGWLLLSQAATIGGGLLFSVLAARRLSASDFADLLIVSSIASFLFGMVSGSVAFRIVRDHAARPDTWSRASLWRSSGRYLLLAAPLGLLTTTITVMIRGESTLAPALLWSVNQALTLLLTAVTARFAARERMEWVALGAVTYAVLSNGTVALIAGSETTLVAMTAIACAAQFIVTSTALLLAHSHLGETQSAAVESQAPRSEFVATTLASGGLLAATRLDYILLNRIQGIETQTAYVAGLRMLDYFRLVPILLINAANPWLSRRRESDDRILPALARSHLVTFVLLGMAGTLFLRGVGTPLVAKAFVLEPAAVASSLVVLSLALPFDMAAWHANWYLLNLRMSWRAATIQFFGLAVHGALGWWLAGTEANSSVGYGLVVSLALAGLIGQWALAWHMRDARLGVLASAMTGVAVLPALLPTFSTLTAGGVALAGMALLIGGGSIVRFLYPGRRLTWLARLWQPTVEWRRRLLVGGVLLAAICSGALTAWSPFLILLAIGAFAALFYLTRSPDVVVALAIFVTAATYRGLFFQVRINFFGSPIGAYDMLWVLVLAAALPAAFHVRSDRLQLPILLFATLAIVAALVGTLSGQLPYNVTKMFRAQIFLVVGYVAARSLSERGQIMALKALVLGGSVTGIAQILTFVFALQGYNIWSRIGISAFDFGSTYFDVSATNTSIFRDNGVTIPFTVFAALVLIAAIATNQFIFPRTVLIGLLSICLAGIVVSLTRAAWLGLLIGGLAAVAATRGGAVRRLTPWAIPVLIAAFLVGVTLWVQTGPPALAAVFQERISSLTAGSADQTLALRFDEARSTLRELQGQWLYGVGAAEIVVFENNSFILRNQLHNGYLHYLLAGGALGLASILLLLFIGVLCSWKDVKVPSSDPRAFVSLAVVCCLISIAALSIVSGVINDAFQTPILGLLLGLAVSYSASQATESRGLPSQSTPPAQSVRRIPRYDPT